MGSNTESYHPIAAVASGAQASAIAIIRFSGSNSHALLDDYLLFKSKIRKLRTMYLADFINAKSEIIDNVMVVMFAHAQSFTGEESGEIYCHGGPYIVRNILATLYNAGFSPAKPGEFTERAYLNERLDLVAAEGILHLTRAQSKQQWQAGRDLANGSLTKLIFDLRQKTLSALAFLAAQLDFPDEGEVAVTTIEKIDELVAATKKEIDSLKASYVGGKVMTKGFQVALVGEPNVGKSTLLNTLLEFQRAIVSPIAGTTRDYVSESCLINGCLVNLVDTAGLRESDDEIEKLGILHSFENAEAANLVVILVNLNTTDNTLKSIKKWVGKFSQNDIIFVYTKDDVKGVTLNSNVDSYIKSTHLQAIKISSLENTGIAQLKHIISTKAQQVIDSTSEGHYIAEERHLHALTKASDNINNYSILRKDDSAYNVDLLSFELEGVAYNLESVIGNISHDNILEEIFKNFCVGK